MTANASRTGPSSLRWLLPIACLLAGGAIGFWGRDRMLDHGGGRAFTAVREGGYRFISPLLECESEESPTPELRPFKEKLTAYLRAVTARDAVAGASIYFRELEDGVGFAVDEALPFTPASLRKVPMMIAILKQAEHTPGLLERGVVANLQQDHDARQNFKPAQPLVMGRTYTVGELLARMIVGSDNNAFMLLSRVVDSEELGKVYGLLAMRTPSAAGGEEPPYAVLTYSSFFRILYNATYLPKDLSDRALELLAEAEFRSGLGAGVPPGVRVAHKFGERSNDASGEKQLHDCGIVYYPHHPYLLCIMTRGAAFDRLADAIASVAGFVYREVDAQHQKEH